MKTNKPKIVSIVGLTASGKSALAIHLAQQFNGEIVSCDSRQVYRGLDIGTAKVTPQQRATVPHHLLDVANPGDHFDVFKFQTLAHNAIDDIIARGRLPILVGGTGLYSRSVVEGYNFKKDSAPSDITTPSIATPTHGNPKYNVLQICLMPPREYIRPLVEQRINERLDAGMLDETRQLLANGVSREWLQSLGLEYYWNIELIEGRITRAQYIENLTTKTMQYAKRQRTWFKRERNTHYLINPSTFLPDCESLVREFK